MAKALLPLLFFNILEQVRACARDKQMETRLLTAEFLPPAATAMLRAIGVPENCQGIASAIPLLQSCITAANKIWPSTPGESNRLSLADAQAKIRSAKAAGADVTLLFSSPSNANDVYSTFFRWPIPIVDSGPTFNMHALLGRSILVVAARKNQVLAAHLISGLYILKNAAQGRGKHSGDWDQLARIDLLDTSALKKFLQTVGRKSPVRTFLESTLQVLETPILAPADCKISEPNLNNENPDYGQADSRKKTTNQTIESKEEVPDATSDDTVNEGTPDIGARFKAADFAPYSIKLGLDHRDQLLLDDLTPITHMLAAHLQGGNSLHVGYAALALSSLLTCSSDTVALKLEFQVGHSIWINLELGCWAWDFQVYRNSQSLEAIAWDPAQTEPIFIPLPRTLIRVLQRAKVALPEANTLSDLILFITGQPSLNLREYRKFLRDCGPTSVHPAYQGRFSRSLPGAYLEITGSDMTTGMVTGQLAAATPAALFYYGPRNGLLMQRINKVYAKLGLGDAVDMPDLGARSGCKKILAIPVLQKGWADLVKEINQVRQLARSSSSQMELIRHCNQWMQLLAAGLVIQSGHRGSRLESLTFGALLLHPSAMLVQDKDEGGRAQPRLLPRTNVVNALLCGALECCHLIHKRCQLDIHGRDFSPDLDAPVFSQWSIDSEKPPIPVTTSMIASITQRHFQSDANFGRSQWVTQLDEHECDRWLIRVLTGHTRDVTRTNGAYLDLPPIIAAKRLGEVMERVGTSIFGSTNLDMGRLDHWNLTIEVVPDADKKRDLCDRVHDPRTILAPLTVSTLVGWNTTDQVRNALTHGEMN